MLAIALKKYFLLTVHRPDAQLITISSTINDFNRHHSLPSSKTKRKKKTECHLIMNYECLTHEMQPSQHRPAIHIYASYRIEVSLSPK